MSTVKRFFQADWSYYQALVDKSYKRPWGTFRCDDGTFIDPHFQENFARMVALCKRRWLGLRGGQVQGFTIYAVYEPGVDIVAEVKAQVHEALAKLPKRLQRVALKKLTVMVDVESWGGRIVGNHSDEINKRCAGFALWLGKSRVIAYGNMGDLSSLFPGRAGWIRVYVAKYSSVAPEGVAGMIGWQYNDGEDRWPVPTGYPRSSAPFGNCDHNVVEMSPEAYATTLGVGKAVPHPPKPKPKPKPKYGANVEHAIDALRQATKQHPRTGPMGQAIHRALDELEGATK